MHSFPVSVIFGNVHAAGDLFVSIYSGYVLPVLKQTFFPVGALHVPLIPRLLGHMAQILELGFDFLSGEIFLQAENSTGSGIQVLAESMVTLLQAH